MNTIGGKLHGDYPLIIDSMIVMEEANAPILIYEGQFILRNESDEITIKGTLQFDWLPNLITTFFGTTQSDIHLLPKIQKSFNLLELIIDGLVFGKAYITSSTYTNSNINWIIRGIVAQNPVSGDKSIAVQKIKFSIPNLREFRGLPVRRITPENDSLLMMNRIMLENDNYSITIDKCYNYEDLKKTLNLKGGFIIQYGGELISKKEAILFDEMNSCVNSLSTFLSFLNGRRTSIMFAHGIFENEIMWCDYSNYTVDAFKNVTTWPQETSVDGLNEIWVKFSRLWSDRENKNFLTSAIHWYVEANKNSGFTEGSIIMAQTALELLYNWLIIENKKLMIGKDSENINASNKIRLLLSQLKMQYEVPSSFTHLQKFIDENNDVIDGPDAIVQVRNAIVHSQQEKRKKLSSMHHMVKSEALSLCIWYIELSLLYILEFNGKYFNRCSGSHAEESVPWANKMS